MLFNLFRNLCDMGVPTTVVTHGIPASMRRQVDRRARVREVSFTGWLKFENNLLAGFFDLITTSLLAFKIEDETDVICFHTENVVPALFFYKLLGRKRPCLYFCYQPPRFAHDTTKETARTGGFLGRFVPLFKTLYRPFDILAVKQAARVCTFSTGYAEWIASIYGIDPIDVLPPGVEVPETLPKVPSLIERKIPANSRILLFVGKLVPWKNVDRLINVVTMIRERCPDVCLLVVGDGPSMGYLSEYTRKRNIEDRVLFCGYVSEKEVFAYYALSDILVLLEKNASFGLSIIEANAVGLPVLAIEGGGPSDIIEHGKNGFLVPPDITDRDIAGILLDFLKNTRSMETMKAHAIASSRSYTWKRFARLFMDTVSTLINPCGRL